MRKLLILTAVLLAAVAARAQAPAAKPDPAQEMRRLCATISMAPADAREMARRSECVLAGVLPSPSRITEARALARQALAAGEPAGGLMLYLVFQNDPANQYMRDGKADMEAYRKLAARSGTQRREQAEAIEGLGFAAGKGNVPAGVLLASYFHDTVAPRNVTRVGALAGLLLRNGERNPMLERFAREADTVASTAAPTKASLRGFLEAYRSAVAAAGIGYTVQSGGKSCDRLELKSVSSSDIEGAEFLPLAGTLVADSYLVRGRWSEYWIFGGCEQEVPVKITFEADGWGGSAATAAHNKGG